MRKRKTALCLGVLAIAALIQALSGAARAQPYTPLTSFTAGDLVVSVEGNGAGDASNGASATGNTGASADSYLDNEAAPLSLYEFTTTGTNQTPVGALVLPQTQSGSNAPISGEYGSSSEGTLQLTGNGQYLTIAGYATNAASYNSASDLNGTGTALAQSCSLSSASSCSGVPQVARVIALIGANGSVNTSTVLYNVFNENNPRSVYSANGTSFYISGQGTGNAGDTTGGVFYVPSIGPGQTAVPITGQDASGNTVSQDTREVQIYNNTLYVSVDSKEGSGNNRDFIGTLGSPPATSTYNSQNGPTMIAGYGSSNGHGTLTITAGTTNGINSAGQAINLSPQDYFFANSTTLYVADSGDPKNSGGSTSGLGDGGLQKWSLVNGSWVLDYTLSVGLNLVANTSTDGSSGLYGLTGEVVGNEVELFATNYTLSDLDQTYLYSITDVLSDTTNPGDEDFIELAAAPADTTFKGVAFAPEAATPLPASWTFMLIGLAGLGFAAYRRGPKTHSVAAA